jgi:hypothetical protein
LHLVLIYNFINRHGEGIFPRILLLPRIPVTVNAAQARIPVTVNAAQEERVKDQAWTLIRMNLTEIDGGNIQLQCDKQSMPSWSAFKEQVPEKIVCFLPVLPYPVTKYKTVYTALKNFQGILDQLKQDKQAIACDEGLGVYWIAKEIMLWRPSEFENIVLCLGSFHMIKIFLGCIGKYLRESGAESIWIENGNPGSVRGLAICAVLGRNDMLSETMERLQWKAFFDEFGIMKYHGVLSILREMKECVSDKNQLKSQQLLGDFAASSDILFADFEEFKRQKSERSETIRFIH